MKDLKEMYESLTENQKHRCQYPPISSEDADKIRWIYCCNNPVVKTFRIKYMTAHGHNLVEVNATNEEEATSQINGDIYDVKELK